MNLGEIPPGRREPAVATRAREASDGSEHAPAGGGKPCRARHFFSLKSGANPPPSHNLPKMHYGNGMTTGYSTARLGNSFEISRSIIHLSHDIFVQISSQTSDLHEFSFNPGSGGLLKKVGNMPPSETTENRNEKSEILADFTFSKLTDGTRMQRCKSGICCANKFSPTRKSLIVNNIVFERVEDKLEVLALLPPLFSLICEHREFVEFSLQ